MVHPGVATWMKMWEVSAIAPMVISYRLTGGKSDPRELSRMSQEKVDAWYEAVLATGQRLFEFNLTMTGMFWRQVWGGPPVNSSRFAALGQGLLTDSLAPVHRRVVANHRRLSVR